MVWMIWSTQSLTYWSSSLGAPASLFPLIHLRTQHVKTLAAKAFQSKLHNIIQYIHNETLGQSSSNGLVDIWSTQSLTWPNSSLGAPNCLFPVIQLRTQPVETLAGKAFQSKLHNIIQHIHNETLEQSSSNGFVDMVHTVTDLA
eukprot:scaffold391169_cov162-Cyclotella_meneghiniana.AAC.1